MTTPLLSRRTLGLWTRFQLKLNILFLCRPKVLHGDHPTVQVMLRHLGGGDRASLSGCPTPSFDQATSGCQNNGEGDPKWGSQYNLTGEMTYSHFNSEEGPDKGPRLRPEPQTIKNNGPNPLKRSQKWVEFQMGVQKELKLRPYRMAPTLVSSRSTRSTDTNKLNIRPTPEATTCPNQRGLSPINTIASNKLQGEQQYIYICANIILTKRPTQ